MADGDSKRKGVLLPIQPTEEGSIRGLYMDHTGVEPVEIHPPGPDGPDPSRGLMNLTPREDAPFVDAEITHEPPGGGHKGPARVTNDAYKAGWDRIWGPKEPAEA